MGDRGGLPAAVARAADGGGLRPHRAGAPLGPAVGAPPIASTLVFIPPAILCVARVGDAVTAAQEDVRVVQAGPDKVHLAIRMSRRRRGSDAEYNSFQTLWVFTLGAPAAALRPAPPTLPAPGSRLALAHTRRARCAQCKSKARYSPQSLRGPGPH